MMRAFLADVPVYPLITEARLQPSIRLIRCWQPPPTSFVHEDAYPGRYSGPREATAVFALRLGASDP